MTVELGAVTVRQLTRVSVDEQAALVHHRVPGANGDVVQALGRPSVRVAFEGIVYGPEAAERFEQLRSAFLAREPLDFYTEAVGEGYFAEVLICHLEVVQRAVVPSQLDFRCEVVEYVEPPEPPADPLGALDEPLRQEAGAFIDDVQDSLAAVDALTKRLATDPQLGVSTDHLKRRVAMFTALTDQGAIDLAAIRDALDGDGDGDE